MVLSIFSSHLTIGNTAVNLSSLLKSMLPNSPACSLWSFGHNPFQISLSVFPHQAIMVTFKFEIGFF